MNKRKQPEPADPMLSGLIKQMRICCTAATTDGCHYKRESRLVLQTCREMIDQALQKVAAAAKQRYCDRHLKNCDGCDGCLRSWS